ncbi:MAG TPA: hypothetical protein VNJ02_19265 [Vicinamibacterales bacterium]|nr:hypothetical protein [Vicinamibacterales bacterium]
MLLILTLITVFLVVVALAGYLAATAWALRDASRSIKAIADGLEAVQQHTVPVGEKLATINGALSALAGGFAAVDGHLSAAARVFRL